MDIAKIGEKALRIKSKNATFIIDPEKKIEEDVVVLTKKPDDYSVYGDKIVIYGPGEYETAGVSIKADATDDGISYDFLEEGQNLIVLSSPKVAKSKDTEGASVVVVFLDESADKLSDISSEVIVVIGSESNLPKESGEVKKVDKLNLKKVEEYKGFLVHLSK